MTGIKVGLRILGNLSHRMSENFSQMLRSSSLRLCVKSGCATESFSNMEAQKHGEDLFLTPEGSNIYRNAALEILDSSGVVHVSNLTKSTCRSYPKGAPSERSLL